MCGGKRIGRMGSGSSCGLGAIGSEWGWFFGRRDWLKVKVYDRRSHPQLGFLFGGFVEMDRRKEWRERSRGSPGLLSCQLFLCHLLPPPNT